MFSTLRMRFGIPGVISVIALVFAMIGGAYAASNAGDGKGATASAKKSTKGPRGPRGAKGATGATGPAGAAGPAGAKGDAGAAGGAGEKGANGTNGKSIALATEPAGLNCAEGGASVEVEGTPASKKYVCNGEAGAEGEPGDPWTAGGTLPSGATQTGLWAFNAASAQEFSGIGAIFVPVSFPIPLSGALDEAHTVFVPPSGTDPNCTGSLANPTAPSGYLCIYASEVVNASLGAGPGGSFKFIAPGLGFNQTATTGTSMLFDIKEGETLPGAGVGSGTWAVTG